MINLDQLISMVTMGIVLIALGLWPGLLQQCSDGIHEVSNLLSPRLGARTSRRRRAVEPHWFALAGVAMILLTLLAYLSN